MQRMNVFEITSMSHLTLNTLLWFNNKQDLMKKNKRIYEERSKVITSDPEKNIFCPASS